MSLRFQQRILAEIREVGTSLFADQGIYYVQDEHNICLGHALIFGPEDSVYHHFPAIFRIEFPTDYPFEPPKVTFLTSDGYTRFHPNLYVQGKVCLSILGTWTGPAWTSVMKLSTLLLTILSLLDRDPALHEPGVKSHPEYAAFVEYRCATWVLRAIKSPPPYLRLFEDVWKSRIPHILRDYMRLFSKKPPTRNLDINLYSIGAIQIKYDKLSMDVSVAYEEAVGTGAGAGAAEARP